MVAWFIIVFFVGIVVGVLVGNRIGIKMGIRESLEIKNKNVPETDTNKSEVMNELREKYNG